MSPEPTYRQEVIGSNNAIAAGGSTAIVNSVNVYQHVAPRPVDEAVLERALERLAAMPLDSVPAPYLSLPHGSRIPLTRNPFFVGREQDLKDIARVLKTDVAVAAVSPIAAATGMGGLGKTQLACEFVFRYGQYFEGGVFWLSFAEPAAIPGEVVACRGAALAYLPPNFSSLSLDEQMYFVLSAWQSPLPRLLVFDNCEDETLLAKWRPPSGGCRVLVTSRRTEWDPTLGIHALPLGVLAPDESVALLRRFRPDLSEDDPDLNAIARELGRLPLALHLAGSYLSRYRNDIPVARYLSQLRDPQLLEHPSLRGEGLGFSPTAHDLNVARTFALSFDRLDPSYDTDKLALKLLARAAHFAPGEPIPRQLLVQTLNLPGEERASPAQDNDADADARAATDALRRLYSLGLLEQEADAVGLHRLLGAFTRNVAPDPQAQHAVEQTLLAVASYHNSKGYPGPLLSIQPHLLYFTEEALNREPTDILSSNLCNELGFYLHMIGDYVAARPLYERALQITEQVLGPDHPNTARSLHNLAVLLQDLGNYAAARPLYERALQIAEQVLGPDYPDTARSLHNLAGLLRDQGDHAAARPLLERALQIRELVLGPDHPDTAASLNNLAELLRDQGDHAAARPLLERALQIREQVLGSDHPDTAISLNNLAVLNENLGNLSDAADLLLRALRIIETKLGSQHPYTTMMRRSLKRVERRAHDGLTEDTT